MSEGQCPATVFDNQSPVDKMMDGGIMYGTICFPKELSKYILMIIFPPLYFIVEQYKQGFPRIDKIIVSFILTSLFYFPGLLHALNELECGSLAASTGKPNKCS